MGTYCGMDFGTSNSVITMLTEDAGKPAFTVVREPSLVYFPEAAETTVERYCGVAALQRYVESGMQGRFFQSVKTLLPDPGFQFTRINGKSFSAEDLVAVVLRALREEMERRTGVTIRAAVFGRPARFSPKPDQDALAEGRLRAAAAQAGFEHIEICPEPVAGAHAYASRLTSEATVFVADHGGGTSDFTLMRLSPGGDSSPGALGRRPPTAAPAPSSAAVVHGEPLATAGVRVGGDDLDADIVWNRLVAHFGHGSHYESWGKLLPVPVHIFRTITRWDRIHFLKTTKYREELRYFHRGSTDPAAIERLMALIERDEGFFLSRAVEAAKIELSDADQARIRLERLDVDEAITRDQFEGYIAENLRKIDAAVVETLGAAGINPDAPAEVDAVFMTGGTSRVPAVRRVMEARFGPRRIVGDADELQSVSRGLALTARRIGLPAS